jgi:hypothetical protein
MIRRILLAITLMACSTSVYALAKVNITAEQGGQRVSVAGFQSTTTVSRTYPGATTAVYLAGTSTLASIYDAGIMVKANPFTASTTDATAPFYVADGVYDITFTCTAPNCTTDPGATWSVTGIRVSGSTSLSIVDVSSYANAGAGTTLSPWTGWDTAITWAANTTYYFRGGTYAYTSAPNWGLLLNIRLLGDGSGMTILQYNGTGNAVEFNQPTTGNVYNPQMENFLINGNAAAQNGILCRACHWGLFRNIKVRNVAAAGLLFEGSVGMRVDNVSVSTLEQGVVFTTSPVNGFVLTYRTAPGDSTTALTCDGCRAIGVLGSGFLLTEATFCTFNGGASEYNNRAVEFASASRTNTFSTFDTEVSTTEDWLIKGSNNTLLNVQSTTLTHIATTASNNSILGGTFRNITIDSGVTDTFLSGLSYAAIGGVSGTLTNNGTRTVKQHVLNAFSGILDSEWTPVTYSAANFTASTGTWTVDSGDQFGFIYRRNANRTMTVQFRINASDVSATPSFLRITLPEGVNASKSAYWIGEGSDAGSAQTVIRVETLNGQPYIFLSPLSGTWTATSGDNTEVRGFVEVEVSQ